MNSNIAVNDGRENHNKVVQFPDICPTCKHHTTPVFLGSFTHDVKPGFQAAFACSNHACNSVIIGIYETIDSGSGTTRLTRVLPTFVSDPETFPESIQSISPDFIIIYRQAYHAEQYHLDQICGAGYRKALEFLIKHFAVHKHSEKKAEIEKALLGPCISNYVDDPRIKSMAARAAWLGNDETHLIRVWLEHDIEDLKNLIKATVNWIDLVKMSEQYETEMPKS